MNNLYYYILINIINIKIGKINKQYFENFITDNIINN
jgi:hypothetical protein